MPSTPARVLFAPDDPGRFLPEGPRAVTLGGRRGILWVNIQTAATARTGTLNVLFPDSHEVRTWHRLPGRPGFALPTDRDGVVLVGCDNHVGTFDLNSGTWTPLAAVPLPHPREIINDAEVVPGGRAVVFGTKDTAFRDPCAGLYLFTLDDNRVSLLRPGQTCSNGKVFADARTLFDIDTPTKCIRRYTLDIDARTLAGGETVRDFQDDLAFPDGMCDAGGGTVIVAFYDGERYADGIARHDDLATGATLHEWPVPRSPKVTCPLLFESGGRVELILTTAWELDEERPEYAANAGCLFAAETDIAAVPPAELVRLG